VGLKNHGKDGAQMATLLADIHIETDGGTGDPAAWDDWVDCIRRVKQD
jgi:hypothetical protein